MNELIEVEGSVVIIERDNKSLEEIILLDGKPNIILDKGREQLARRLVADTVIGLEQAGNPLHFCRLGVGNAGVPPTSAKLSLTTPIGDPVAITSAYIVDALSSPYTIRMEFQFDGTVLAAAAGGQFFDEEGLFMAHWTEDPLSPDPAFHDMFAYKGFFGSKFLAVAGKTYIIRHDVRFKT